MNSKALGIALSLLLVTGLTPLAAQDSAETISEQQKALSAEAPGFVSPSPSKAQVSGSDLGAGNNLFVAVDESAESTYVIDPTGPTTTPAFAGFEPWGAASIPDGGGSVVYFNSGADLYRYQFPGPPALCCTMMFSAASTTVVSAAYNPTAGRLLFTRNIATEAVYSLAATAGACPVSCDLTQDIVYSADDNDFGGLAYDDATDTLYGTNDDTTPGPAGVYEINGDGTTTLVVAYPAGETDIDGLAFDNGRLYLVTDEPGDIYVYNVGTASFETPITNPWTTSETFSAATFGAGLLPVEVQSFTIE